MAADETPRKTCNAPSGEPDLTCELDDDGHVIHECRLLDGGKFVWTGPRSTPPSEIDRKFNRMALGGKRPLRLEPAQPDAPTLPSLLEAAQQAYDDAQPDAAPAPDACPRCTHATARHWPDDARSKPGCHAPECLCSFDPEEIALAVAPAPDGNTGGAGDEPDDGLEPVRVYRSPQLGDFYVGLPAGWLHIHPDGRTAWGQPIGDDLVRLAPLAGRAPLLARIEHLTASHNFVTDEALRLRAVLAEAIRERDEALHVLRQFADDEPCHFDHDGNCQAHRLEQAPCSTAEARRLMRLDETRAKIDGGEWATRYYGDAEQADRNEWWSTIRRSSYTHRRRVWAGPVEPADGDGTS